MFKENVGPIFGIGLPKTGTTSLISALSILGLSVHIPGKISRKSDAFVGDRMCVPLDRYKDLDRLYPDALFIYTMRSSPSDWIESVKRWDKKYGHYISIRDQRRLMYGTPDVDEGVFMTAYIERYSEVYEYFSDRYGQSIKTKLLIISWDKGDGWDELCGFLGLPVPAKSFPHKNKST